MKKIKFCKTKPNLYLQLPINCNRKCTYCFMKQYNKEYCKKEQLSYCTKLKKVLQTYKFTNVSISGGEPTIDILFLEEILLILKTNGVEKIVMHTNGDFLTNEKVIEVINNSVTVLNISEHTQKEDYSYIDSIKTPVTLNKVIKKMPSSQQIKEEVKRINVYGFKSMCYRKDYAIEKNVFEQTIDSTLIPYKTAYSCLGDFTFRWYKVNDFLVTLSTGLEQPNKACSMFNNDKIKYVYSAILFPDATLRYDWSSDSIIEKIEKGNYKKYCKSFSSNTKFKINK